MVDRSHRQFVPVDIKVVGQNIAGDLFALVDLVSVGRCHGLVVGAGDSDRQRLCRAIDGVDDDAVVGQLALFERLHRRVVELVGPAAVGVVEVERAVIRFAGRQRLEAFLAGVRILDRELAARRSQDIFGHRARADSADLRCITLRVHGNGHRVHRRFPRGCVRHEVGEAVLAVEVCVRGIAVGAVCAQREGAVLRVPVIDERVGQGPARAGRVDLAKVAGDRPAILVAAVGAVGARQVLHRIDRQRVGAGVGQCPVVVAGHNADGQLAIEVAWRVELEVVSAFAVIGVEKRRAVIHFDRDEVLVSLVSVRNIGVDEILHRLERGRNGFVFIDHQRLGHLGQDRRVVRAVHGDFHGHGVGSTVVVRHGERRSLHGALALAQGVRQALVERVAPRLVVFVEREGAVIVIRRGHLPRQQGIAVDVGGGELPARRRQQAVGLVPSHSGCRAGTFIARIPRTVGKVGQS